MVTGDTVGSLGHNCVRVAVQWLVQRVGSPCQSYVRGCCNLSFEGAVTMFREVGCYGWWLVIVRFSPRRSVKYSHVTKDAEPPEVKAQNTPSRTMSEGCGECATA